MLLTLNLRECWLGPKYSGKVETVEGRKIRPLQFEIEALQLTDRELNALLGEPDAWHRLHKSDHNGEITPFLRGCKSIELQAAIKDASVRLQYGKDFEHEMIFNGCKLRKLKLSLLDEGITALSCEVKTKPTLDDTLAQLFEFFDERVCVELIFMPPNVQAELPLSTVGLGEEPPKPAVKATKSRRVSGASPTVQ